VVTGDIIRRFTRAAPRPCPSSVTSRGFPPKGRMFSCIQWSAATWSSSA